MGGERSIMLRSAAEAKGMICLRHSYGYFLANRGYDTRLI